MTLAICPKCGNEKFGALPPCAHCGYIPKTGDEVNYAMLLTDHYHSSADLSRIATEIRHGETPTIDPALSESIMSDPVDPEILQKIEMMSDPEFIKRSRRREQAVIISFIAILLLFLGWLIYRIAIA